MEEERMMENKLEKARKAAGQFQMAGEVADIQSYGNGHINDTYLVHVKNGENVKRMILQGINTDIFQDVDGLMENIQKVTSFLREEIVKEGGDPERETLNVVPTLEGKSYFKAEDGKCYRMYKFIEGAVTYDAVRTPEDFYESGKAFGNFQSKLAAFPAEELHETIPDFHNTPVRFARFEEVVKEDKLGRAKDVQEEINFVLSRKALAEELAGLLKAGKLPLRVTHNDTKLNNIMLDEKTGKAVCIIDLDTVMPGLSVNDFGDSIRFGASTGAEDERDLTKVECSMELFELYTKGFVEGCKGRLTEAEMDALPLGAMTMTYECGMRFLTDYLEGDTYFRIHREGHNLDRARTQFKLVADMEQKLDTMKAIVAKYR